MLSETLGAATEPGFAEPAETGGLTLVEGSTFALCEPGGDMDPHAPHGLFVHDARIISCWQLLIDGAPLEALRGFTDEPFAGVYVSRARTREGRLEPTVLVERRRYVGVGMREDLILHNYGPEAAGVAVQLRVAADFADLFAVKVGAASPPGTINVGAESGTWHAWYRQPDGAGRDVRVSAPDASATADGLLFRVAVPAHDSWQTSLQVVVSVNGEDLPPRFPAGSPIERAAPVRRIAQWRRQTPSVEAGSQSLSTALARSETDLAALRIADPTQPDIAVVAAGAPWFMTLFGRDSLIVSSMMMPINPDLATGTLRTLARYQGTSEDPLSEEQPGRILHELRFGVDSSLTLGGADRYYGTADATPLFVMVLGQLARWGVDQEVIAELLPAADRALAWIERYGDRDGDGFVEYLRSTDRGLRNQGWKDSTDGITFANGAIAEPPIALVEVQAYAYGAYRARAVLAGLLESRQAADAWAARAEDLKARFNDRFWLPEQGYYALGLDADKRPIDSLASNMGHCLWTGIADEVKAAAVSRRLLSPEMFTGYGIRTLASTMRAYNPASYHNGSVWPHDTAIAVTGLVRYGHTDAAQRVALGLTDASAYFAGRLPELFCGFDRAELPGPVPYPTSCSPQAWASAAPVALLTAMLGLEPDLPHRRVTISPALPPHWGGVHVANLHVGRSTLDVTVERDGTWRVGGGEDLTIVSPDQW